MLNLSQLIASAGSGKNVSSSGNDILNQQLGIHGRGLVQLPWGAATKSALSLLIGMMFALPAHAEISDTIHPFATVSYTYDDNLLLRPTNGTGVDAPLSDSSKRIEAGLSFDRPFGRQILSGYAKVSRVSYDRLSSLDYNGSDLLAALNWHVGSHVDGNLGVSYSETLASFADFHSADRNLVRKRGEYVDGGWLFHPNWRLRAGFTRDNYGYDLASQAYNNRTEDAGLLGIDFLASSSSTVGFQLRRVKGIYPNQRSVGGLLIDDGYEQNEAKANISWAFSGTTQIDFLGGWTQRKQSFVSGSNESGANYRVVGHWSPLGQVGFTAAGWREFAAVDALSSINGSTSSLNKGASLGANWAVSAKVSANAQLSRQKRDFSALNGIVAPQDAADVTNGASVGVSYALLKSVQLGGNVSHMSRNSDAISSVNNNYRSNAIAVNATGQF